MNDAISRSELIKTLREWPEHLDILNNPTCEEYAERYGNLEALSAILGEVERLPTLDVAPVVHARWIEDGYRGIPCVCSHCGEEAHYTSIFKEQFDYDWDENLVPCGYEEIREYIKSKSCPECGARMDGETND